MTRALGIIHMVVSAVLLALSFGGLLLAWALGSNHRIDDAIGFGVAILVILVVALCYPIPGFIGGWGLVHGKPWARGLIMVVSLVLLILFPLGTVLGGYSLWVLFTDTPDPPPPGRAQSVGSRSNTPSNSA